MKKEGEVRISSGCAISGIFRRDGKRISGEAIRRSIAVMHDRSNGLGGGFAAYGIYPQYKDHFALHIFYDSQSAREETERFLDRRFDIINLSKIPVRRTAAITDATTAVRFISSLFSLFTKYQNVFLVVLLPPFVREHAYCTAAGGSVSTMVRYNRRKK